MGFKYFIFGNYIDEVLMMVDLDSTNSIANGDYYYGHDHLYSPAVLFYEDGTGAEIVEHYEGACPRTPLAWNAYGKVQVLTDSDGDGIWFDDAGDTVYASSQYGNPYTFTGRRLDVFDYNSTTGDYDYEIMYYRARYYDTDTGRFIQRDPLGILPDGDSIINPFDPDRQYQEVCNVYEYVRSNSVVAVDPAGLSGCYPLPMPKKPHNYPWKTSDFVEHYMDGKGATVDLADVGLLEKFKNSPSVSSATSSYKLDVLYHVLDEVYSNPCDGDSTSIYIHIFDYGNDDNTVTNVTWDGPLFSVGKSTFFRDYDCAINIKCCGYKQTCFSFNCTLMFSIKDKFKDPLDIGIEIPGSTIYSITANWTDTISSSSPSCGL